MVKNKSRVRVRAISGLQLVGSRPWTGFRLNCICWNMHQVTHSHAGIVRSRLGTSVPLRGKILLSSPLIPLSVFQHISVGVSIIFRFFLCCFAVDMCWGLASRRHSVINCSFVQRRISSSEMRKRSSLNWRRFGVSCMYLLIYLHSVNCYAELAISSPVVAETITSTHCTYPRRDGQAECMDLRGLER